MAAPAAQASGPAAWAAEKLAGGIISGAGGAGFGSAISAIGLGDGSTAEFAAIRRDLAEIKQQLTVVSDQLRGLSSQLAQTGCNTGSHQLGDVRSRADDGWERYTTLLNRTDAAARAAGLPKLVGDLSTYDHRAARKRVHTALAAPGAGAQTLLQICGEAIEKLAYPFLNADAAKRVRAFLDDWQLVQVRLSVLEVERLILDGDRTGAQDEVDSLRRDLAAQEKLMPKAIPGDVFLDLRTNLVWSRKAEAVTYDAIRKAPATLAQTPTLAQTADLLRAPCCTIGDGPGNAVTRQRWLERRAGVDFRGYLNRNPPMAGLWTTFLPDWWGEQWVVRLVRDVTYNVDPHAVPLRTKETHVLLRVRPRAAADRWSVSQTVCLAEDAATTRAAEAPTSSGAKVRRVGRTWYGTPAGDTITAGARSVVRSGKGPDVITVGPRSRVYAGGCNDVVYVKGTGSVVHGGRDHDTVRVGGGRATVYGDGGNDDLRGGRGDDRISGGSGDDRIDGGAGDDVLMGGPGRDTIHGGPGNDRIFARDGVRDIVDCGSGDDVATVDRKDVVRDCERVARR